MISTAGRSAPFNFVISPTWSISGNRCLVTWIGKGSISLDHTGRIPFRTADKGKPPIPSNKLPRRSRIPVDFPITELFACQSPLDSLFIDLSDALLRISSRICRRRFFFLRPGPPYPWRRIYRFARAHFNKFPHIGWDMFTIESFHGFGQLIFKLQIFLLHVEPERSQLFLIKGNCYIGFLHRFLLHMERAGPESWLQSCSSSLT